MYYSLVIVLVNVCFDRLGALNVHQVDLYFFENELVCMMFLHLEDDLWRMGRLLFFQWSCRILFRIQLVFRSIVFCEVGFCIYMQVLFLDIFENVLIYFLYYECF